MSRYRVSTGQFGYPQPEDPYLEETYDLSVACATCEIGKKPLETIYHLRIDTVLPAALRTEKL
jgi:hypothetical protein